MMYTPLKTITKKNYSNVIFVNGTCSTNQIQPNQIKFYLMLAMYI